MTIVNALVCSALEPDLNGVALGQIELPEIRPDQIQVQVHAAALNFPDLLMTRDGYQHKPTLPFVPGMEGAGRVIQVGAQVETIRVGDAVHFSGKTGACAELVNVHANRVWALPDGFSFAEGAAFRVGALTAYVSLVTRGQLQRGETLLVHGASGGMGLAAVQLGVHLGATVIATGTDMQRLSAAGECGASHCLVLGQDLHERVKALTDGVGAQVVFDPVGGDAFDQSVRAIAKQGRLLVVGFASGRIAQLATNIALIKELSVIGIRAGELGRRQPALGQQIEAAIQALGNQGVMKPHIGARFGFDQAKDALEALGQRSAAGKIVVSINSQ